MGLFHNNVCHQRFMSGLAPTHFACSSIHPSLLSERFCDSIATPHYCLFAYLDYYYDEMYLGGLQKGLTKDKICMHVNDDHTFKHAAPKSEQMYSTCITKTHILVQYPIALTAQTTEHACGESPFHAMHTVILSYRHLQRGPYVPLEHLDIL